MSDAYKACEGRLEMLISRSSLGTMDFSSLRKGGYLEFTFCTCVSSVSVLGNRKYSAGR
jgi:hypothetical protein